jgi:prepilin-type processing-associated H-X9-DG protein
MGLAVQMNANDTGYLCSGAFDHARDGDIRQIGWVADMVNRGYLDPGAMRCPTSPCPMSEKWNDIWASSGHPGTTIGDGTLPVPPAKLTTEECLDAIKAGYNTNYATSWYMVRTAMQPGVYPSKMQAYYEALLGRTLAASELGNPKARYDTVGPLSLGVVDRVTGTALDRIPLIADGNYGDFGEATLLNDLGEWKAGTIGCESFSDGPIMFPGAWTGITDALGNPMDVAGQDYVDFAPWHGGGSKMSCNMLFADGHVGSVQDKDGDTIIGYSGNPAKPGDFSELDGLYWRDLTGTRRSGKL